MFSLRAAANRTSLSFDEQEEVGDIGKLGRYHGQPQSYGAAQVRAPKNVPHEKKVKWLVRKILLHLSVIRECGATNIRVDLAIYHDGQCNCEFDTEEIRMLAECGVPLTVSVYEDEKMAESK
jgi:hypothetical protein